MQLTVIRNATLILDYAGHRILIDPYFAPMHSLPSFTGASKNPMVELPRTPEAILDGVEMVLVSHLHTDHFDKVAQDHLPKTWPLYCQPVNATMIRDKGFKNVIAVEDEATWHNIHITRTGGHHGLGAVGEIMQPVSGFVLQAAGEPTLYWAGDTVLCDEVRDAIAQFHPDLIVTHSCGAKWPHPDNTDQRELIVMDAEQTIATARLAPDSIIVATHMEALDHSTVSRADLQMAVDEAMLATRVRIPADGESIRFSS